MPPKIRELWKEYTVMEGEKSYSPLHPPPSPIPLPSTSLLSLLLLPLLLLLLLLHRNLELQATLSIYFG